MHGQQEGAAYNGHRVCLLSSPLSVQPVWGLRRSERPGNVHSADGWQELLEPVVKGYQKKGLRLLFRGDAAFASYTVSGTRKDRVRHPASRQSGRSRSNPCWSVLPPSREPIVSYHDFAYQAQSWHLPRRVVGRVASGGAISQGWHRDQPQSYPPKGIVRFYNGRGMAEQWMASTP